MAGIYIHIPFCKQACHYCDFHFSTNFKYKEPLIQALCKEIVLRTTEISEPIETIYFGGGTPSVLTNEELNLLIDTVYNNYIVSETPEITLEANPDDLSETRIIQLSESPINRLSIGVQSFFEDDLQLMNRSHNASEALECIKNAMLHFNNVSIDLIYGIPEMSLERWQQNLNLAISLGVPHISSYALTVEPKTALEKLIQKGKISPVSDDNSKQHYLALLETTEKEGFINYEFSNFGKTDYFSKNNTAYWQGKPYLGIGPSAHSFNGKSRSWNISNNIKYIKSLSENTLPSEAEMLSETDRYNEYIMTGLRTIWGVSVKKVVENFGKIYADYLLQQSEKLIQKNHIIIENNVIKITKKGKFLSDGIASSLFMID